MIAQERNEVPRGVMMSGAAFEKADELAEKYGMTVGEVIGQAAEIGMKRLANVLDFQAPGGRERAKAKRGLARFPKRQGKGA